MIERPADGAALALPRQGRRGRRRGLQRDAGLLPRLPAPRACRTAAGRACPVRQPRPRPARAGCHRRRTPRSTTPVRRALGWTDRDAATWRRSRCAAPCRPTAAAASGAIARHYIGGLKSVTIARRQRPDPPAASGSRMGGVDKNCANHQGTRPWRDALLDRPGVCALVINTSAQPQRHESPWARRCAGRPARLPGPAGQLLAGLEPRNLPRHRALRHAAFRSTWSRAAYRAALEAAGRRHRDSTPPSGAASAVQPVFCLMKTALMESRGRLHGLRPAHRSTAGRCSIAASGDVRRCRRAERRASTPTRWPTAAVAALTAPGQPLEPLPGTRRTCPRMKCRPWPKSPPALAATTPMRCRWRRRGFINPAGAARAGRGEAGAAHRPAACWTRRRDLDHRRTAARQLGDGRLPARGSELAAGGDPC